MLLLVHLSSLVQRRSRASSFEKAEVELEHDQLELRSRIAWLSERLAAGAALTAQIRPFRQRPKRLQTACIDGWASGTLSHCRGGWHPVGKAPSLQRRYRAIAQLGGTHRRGVHQCEKSNETSMLLQGA